LTLNSSPSIDHEMISQLKDAVGDASFAWLRDTCIANSTARLDTLSTAMARADMDEVRACAHALAGLFAQFGMAAVEKAAREVESAEERLLSAAVASLVEIGRTALRELRDLA
jgi:HPt (histidine-containing phosphotransfer) domain-containing protein